MSKDKDYPNWFLSIWERGPVLVFGAALLLTAAVFGGAMYLDGRLEEIEDRLVYQAPRSYSPPDLGRYAAGDVDFSSLPVRKLIYVPAYSHVYYQGGSPYLLETTLSIRNVDSDRPIYVSSIQYFDTDGKLVRTPVEETIKLEPLQTVDFLVERQDSTGGSGANFLVDWGSDDDVNEPMVETVMVGTSGTQGICFSRSGIEITRP